MLLTFCRFGLQIASERFGNPIIGFLMAARSLFPPLFRCACLNGLSPLHSIIGYMVITYRVNFCWRKLLTICTSDMQCSEISRLGNGGLKVRDLLLFFLLALPRPAEGKKKWTQFSRTFTHHFQSMEISYSVQHYLSPQTNLTVTAEGMHESFSHPCPYECVAVIVLLSFFDKYREVRMDFTPEIKYSIWCLRDVTLKIEWDRSNSIYNTSISGGKFSWTTLYWYETTKHSLSFRVVALS